MGDVTKCYLTALSTRETQVLSLIARDGSTNKAIALELAISEETVKSHLRLIFEKLNVTSRTAAATMFRSWRGPASIRYGRRRGR
jgi:DNA-binding NarL/FixJ family response regulator